MVSLVWLLYTHNYNAVIHCQRFYNDSTNFKTYLSSSTFGTQSRQKPSAGPSLGPYDNDSSHESKTLAITCCEGSSPIFQALLKKSPGGNIDWLCSIP